MANYPLRVSLVSVYLPDDYSTMHGRPHLKHHAFPCSIFIFVYFAFDIRKGAVEYKALARPMDLSPFGLR
jgi:hypothetical protein